MNDVNDLFIVLTILVNHRRTIMSKVTNKEQITPSKQPGLFPIDMSWDHMDDVFHNMRRHWPFHMSEDKLFKSNDFNLNPNVDIKEDTNAYEIAAELPGMEVDDISLDIADRVLTISGEKKTEKNEDKAQSYHVMERKYGYFKRSFTLPACIEQDHIKAEFKKGILHISLPKSESARETQRKIKINA